MLYKMTVIVPSYNNGQYMSQCLDSILNQETDFDYQIIITDDASEDGSQEIIKSYAEKYPDRIVALYSEQNCRLFRNVLKALKIMDTEYYCVLDPDDYWVDMHRLQKAVDFLDKNKDYTIYSSNIENLYNNGSREIKYDFGGRFKTSTYEDFLNGRAILASTQSATYRNVCFNDGIPEEFYALKGSKYEENFRADTARNLMHLVKGKSYFVNEVVAIHRYHGEGLYSGISTAERYIGMAFGRIGYYEYFGKEHYKEYRKIVSDLYTQTLRALYRDSLNGMLMAMRPKWQSYYDAVTKWLQENKSEGEEKPRLAFSLSKFSQLASKKVIVWGTGSGAEKFLKKYGIEVFMKNIIYFVDKDPNKYGTEFMGKTVATPAAMKQEKDFILLIASSFDKEIVEQIRKEKLCPETEIVNLQDYDRNWCPEAETSAVPKEIRI